MPTPAATAIIKEIIRGPLAIKTVESAGNSDALVVLNSSGEVVFRIDSLGAVYATGAVRQTDTIT